jgi:hypothetical protein
MNTGGSSAAAWSRKLRRSRLAFVLCSSRQCAQLSRCAKARSARTSLVASPFCSARIVCALYPQSRPVS